ncbi:uncharacterized protein [Elaeis guineensis]|uniref:uncharacterized protein isoform X4 n=1 Tax=Elaeis guineensis var. tenera TaxID=51953 RepID=UPI003C6D882A
MWILRHILLLEIFYPCAVLFYYSDWLMVFIYFELEVLFESSANCWIGRFGGWRNSWCCPRIQYGNSISAKARERTQMAAFLYRGTSCISRILKNFLLQGCWVYALMQYMPM